MSVAMTPRDSVIAQAWSWLGTPYHHHGRVKGVGVDCAQLLCACFEDAGLVPHVDPGFYPHDWHLHRSEELFIGWLARAGAVQVERGRPGDVALFRFGRTFSHGAILVDERSVVHAYVDVGVILTRFDEEPLLGRPTQFWSVGEGGAS